MDRSQWLSPAALGIVAVLALIAVLAAASYHATADLDANFKAANINPDNMHPWQPPAHPPG